MEGPKVALALALPQAAEVGPPARAPHRPAARRPKAGPADAVESGEEEERLETASILALRQAHLGPNVALFFKDDPLHIVAASGCRLYDGQGRSWLDCINNVSHVGHAHPRVAAAVGRQLATLNTNCRYLSAGLPTYCARLAATMPAPLSTVYMVVSGSEANDLAWRVATANARRGAGGAAPDRRPLHAIVMDHAYHGHTSLCIDLSPYKHNGPGGWGTPSYVHVLPCPDTYRGTNLDGAAAAREAVAEIEAAGGRLAAFFSESIISCGGQVVLPPGYLSSVYGVVRAAGGVCVADEVQCGFGRVGSSFWAFQSQGVVPDIVTVGKPIGNGYPMAGLVTTPDLAAGFANGMEFFATYGGSNAAIAAGHAVMDVIEEEGLVENAARVGARCASQLRLLAALHPDTVGDVRGDGLMLGVEIVTDSASKVPGPAVAKFIKSYCKDKHRVLLSTEGPYENVIKIKPPICFTADDADCMLGAIAAALRALGEDPALHRRLVLESHREVQGMTEHRCRL